MSEISSVETTSMTKTCTFDKENDESEDTKESKNLDYTVGLTGSDISSTVESSPPHMKPEPVVAEITDSVEEISQVNEKIISVMEIF